MKTASSRPAAQPEEMSRDALLRTTSELMIELGKADVSLQAIAKRAGVTAPLLTYHFGSKEGLLVALIERDTARSLGQLAALEAMPIDPLSKLKLHITGIIRTYQRYPYLLTLLNSLMRESRTAMSERLKSSVVTPLIEAQRRIVEEGVVAGQFRPLDTDQLYFAIVGACQYLFASRVAFAEVMDGRPMSLDFARDFASTAVDVLINGLATREP